MIDQHVAAAVGQSNDGLFRLAYEKKLSVVVDTITRLQDKYVGMQREREREAVGIN